MTYSNKQHPRNNAAMYAARIAFVRWWTDRFPRGAGYSATLGAGFTKDNWESGAYAQFLKGRRAMPQSVWAAFTSMDGEPRYSHYYNKWGAALVAEGNRLHQATITPGRRRYLKGVLAPEVEKYLGDRTHLCDVILNNLHLIEAGNATQATLDETRATTKKLRDLITGHAVADVFVPPDVPDESPTPNWLD